jgi:hypothetical protein
MPFPDKPVLLAMLCDGEDSEADEEARLVGDETLLLDGAALIGADMDGVEIWTTLFWQVFSRRFDTLRDALEESDATDRSSRTTTRFTTEETFGVKLW